MEQRKLKVGIIGCGRIAGAHAISYNKMDDVEVVGLADIIPGKAKAFAEQWGLQSARLYDNHLDLLENEELDGVSICTYNMQHAVCAIDALNRGINVVIEKPMCVTMEDAATVCDLEIAWQIPAGKKIAKVILAPAGKELEYAVEENTAKIKLNRMDGYALIKVLYQ